MSVFNDWFEKSKNVITDPQGFFRTVERSDGYGYPATFVAISFAIAGITTALGALVFNPVGVNPVTAALYSLIGSIIGGLIGLFIGAGLVHIFVYLFGGRGYQRTFEVGAYTTAIAPISALVGLIPVIGGLLGLLVAIYAVYIQIRGIELYHGLSTGKAALAVLLPAIIIGLIVAVMAVALLSFLVTTGVVTSGTTPL